VAEEERTHIKRDIDELIARGFVQTSRKYRLVAGLPAGKTGVEALREANPERLERLLKWLEEKASSEYRTYCAEKEGNQLTLTWGEFNEFLVKTGRSPAPLEMIKERAIERGTYDPKWDVARTGRFLSSQENHCTEPKAEK